MAENKTVFNRLGDMFMGTNPYQSVPKRTTTYNVASPNTVLYQTNDKADYERKKAELRQQKLLNHQWIKAGADNAMQALSNYTNVQMMYRDADLMDAWPEIGAALDIVMEEACNLNAKGRMLNINSKSPRIKAILEDLFVNRLNIHMMLPYVTREMVKYGNNFMLLNINNEEGITGWIQLPVYEMNRIENGYMSPYVAANAATSPNDTKPRETIFIRVGHEEQLQYKAWQVGHFRLITDSIFLPYGTSWLHKARRSWRMLSMMEDAMLIYRLDKSIERRIYKINVGAIDENDVQAYIQDVANNFKRTPIIDPQTGQVDLRKNFLDVSADYFIPIRGNQDPSSIETLASAQYSTAMDDIEYMHNKIMAALRVPKTFLNFNEAQGKGQNLSLLDVRFCRMIQRVQQSLLVELNKIATVHLYLLGFRDDLTNFTLTLNNPSAQIEALELEDLTKRLDTATKAVADPGTGIPLFSIHKALRDIMKMDDKEIADMMNEIRLEKAMAAELQATANVIKKTGVFDPVDRIYGDPNAAAAPAAAPGMDGGMGGGMGGGAMGGGAAGGFDGGSMSMDSLGGAAGAAGTTDMGGAPEASAGMGAPAAPAGGAAPMMEQKNHLQKAIFEQYMNKLNDEAEDEKGNSFQRSEIYDKGLMINEEFQNIFDELDGKLNETESEEDESQKLND